MTGSGAFGSTSWVAKVATEAASAFCCVDGVGELLLGRDLGAAEDVAVGHAVGFIELRLVLDQHVGHEPVDGVPRLGDLGGHGVAEHLRDRGHEVVVHDLVLVLADAQRDVLVGDAVQHHDRVRRVRVHELGGEGRDRGRERLLLRALLLVAAVEGVGDELRVRGEHLVVERLRDGLDVLTHRRERGLDDLGVLLAEVVELRVRLFLQVHAVSFRAVEQLTPTVPVKTSPRGPWRGAPRRRGACGAGGAGRRWPPRRRR